jgi:septal ring factor EnvC (AmiA/AmiB activator)
MEDKIKKLIKEIKQTQDALKLHAPKREVFKKKIDSLRQEIESLKNEIQASRKLERVDSEYLSELARRYSAEVSTDFPDQTTGWRPIFPSMRSKIYGHGANPKTAYQ